MRKFIKASIISAILLGGNSCIPIFRVLRYDKHDPDMAAFTAILFAKEAFIDLNQPDAYDFLSEEMKRRTSLDQYIILIGRMHPKAFPHQLTATEYEQTPGKEALFIWLYGEKGEEKFYYKLMMEGIAASGYKVGEMIRVVKPSASSLRKSLPVTRSTSELR